MYAKSRGIVLSSLKYGDTSLICKIYTEQFGLQSYIFKGVRKKNARIRPAQLQALSLVELIARHSDKSSLHIVKELSLIHPMSEIPFNVRKSAVALFLAELILKCIGEEEENREQFNFIFDHVVLLDQSSKGLAAFYLLFMIHFTRFLGFFPAGSYSSSSPNFNLREGVFDRNSGNKNEYMLPPLSKKFDAMIRLPIGHFQGLVLDLEMRKELLDTLLDYYKHHVPSFGTMKSHKVLEDVFH